MQVRGYGEKNSETRQNQRSEVSMVRGRRPRVVVVREEVCGVRGKRPGKVGVREWRSWAMVAKEEASGLG